MKIKTHLRSGCLAYVPRLAVNADALKGGKAQERNAMLQAEKVEVHWDSKKNQWRIRVKIGQQIIKRVLGRVGRDASEEILRSKAIETVNDEGYAADSTQLEILGPDSERCKERSGECIHIKPTVFMHTLELKSEISEVGRANDILRRTAKAL